MKTYIIDRSKWRNGGISPKAKGLGYTRLLNSKNFMCCLGQCLRQDHEDLNLLNLCYPENTNMSEEAINTSPFVYMKNLDISFDSKLSTRAMMINDDTKTNIKEKERSLKALFKEFDLKIKFINRSIPYEHK